MHDSADTKSMIASRTNFHPGDFVTRSPVHTTLKVFLKEQTISTNTEYRVYK